MKSALNSRKQPKLSLWRWKSSTLGTTDSSSSARISARLSAQQRSAPRRTAGARLSTRRMW